MRNGLDLVIGWPSRKKYREDDSLFPGMASSLGVGSKTTWTGEKGDGFIHSRYFESATLWDYKGAIGKMIWNSKI